MLTAASWAALLLGLMIVGPCLSILGVRHFACPQVDHAELARELAPLLAEALDDLDVARTAELGLDRPREVPRAIEGTAPPRPRLVWDGPRDVAKLADDLRRARNQGEDARAVSRVIGDAAKRNRRRR